MGWPRCVDTVNTRARLQPMLAVANPVLQAPTMGPVGDASRTVVDDRVFSTRPSHDRPPKRAREWYKDEENGVGGGGSGDAVESATKDRLRVSPPQCTPSFQPAVRDDDDLHAGGRGAPDPAAGDDCEWQSFFVASFPTRVIREQPF